MSDEECVRMTIKFVNGSEEHYTFPRQVTEEDAHILMNKVQEALGAQHLIIDLGSKVQILPFNNILQVELSPPPAKLPVICIKGASLV